MVEIIDGFVPYRPEDVETYQRNKWWGDLSLGEVLDRAADMHPEKEGFVDTLNRVTYGEAREKADRLALSLIEMGIKPLDRVLLQLPNWVEFVYAFFACQKIGAITVLMIDRYRQYEIGQLIELTNAKAWIVPVRYGKTDYLPIIDDILESHPGIKNVITVRDAVDRPNFSELDALIEKAELNETNRALLRNQYPDAMQVAHMGPTGGTTGLPKIVPRIHNSLVCCVQHCSMSWDQHCEDYNLIVGPIGHDLSFTKGFLGSIITQGKVFLLDNTDNAAICETIEKEGITSIVWVPTLAQRMLQFEDLDKYNLSSLKKMHSGGGASHEEMIQGVIEKLGMNFYNGYGATEGMTTITRSVDDIDTICYTVGRPTFPHDIYKVVDRNGNQLPVNTPGELMVKGPSVFSGYYNNPMENAQSFTADGFFRTGDIARIDERGYITLVGRIKEMINRGGESISATAIEKLISTHPDVVSVAVIPMPDPLMGEKACAYIQPAAGTTLTFEMIIDHLKAQKASVLELPERMEFIEQMPYTKVQKMDKKRLRKDIEDKLSATTAD